jgi:aldehyde:ferredoxin oxidoreductase
VQGVWNTVLNVNLGIQSSETSAIPDEVYDKYGMGIGLGSYLLYNEIAKGTKALSAENVMVITPGLFVGTGVPTGSKTVILFKSPLTGGFGRAVVGGHLGVALRKSGLDAILVKGRSEKPVIIKIDDNLVEFIDAAPFMGKGAVDVQSQLRKVYGKNYRTCAIGPAGENLNCIAGIDFEQRQAARGGGGAVLGSKNVKAILVKGTQKVPICNPNKLKGLIKKWKKELKEHPATQADLDYGSGEWWEWHNLERGTCPARNFQWGYFQSVYDNIEGGEKSKLDPYYWAPKYGGRHTACPNCTKPCGRIVNVKEGKYAGTKLDGIEYETLYSLGSVLEIDDIEATAKMNEICDQEGLDTISAGVTIAWAMEAYEKGLLPEDQLDGIKLNFGNADAAIEVLKLISGRKGYLGKLLADGVKKAAEKIGMGSDKFAIHSKGLEFPGYDVRGLKGTALAFAVSVRGACHLSAAVHNWDLAGKYWEFKGIDRFDSEWRGFQVKSGEDLTTVYDIYGVCKFSRYVYFLEGFKDIQNSITGCEKKDSDIMLMGERVYNLQKMFNVREGLDRKDDTLPYRMTHEKIPKGASQGAILEETELRHLLDQYYMARGWSKNGIPTRAKLASLDLSGVVEEDYGANI